MNLPAAYAWLATEPGPKMLAAALAQLGIKEVPGPGNNPRIMAMAQELGVTAIHTGDDVPWCGLLMAKVAKDAGKTLPANFSRAKAWAAFGQPAPVPMLGDVLVFERNGGGHVGMYVGEDKTAFHVLGGNQSDAVTITRIANDRLFTARRPEYSIGQPANVRQVLLAPGGALSTNEA
jgi:uncharacterized protein (TIGR02594 family)